ncbi:MAG TPA: YihY/virulence factor BrkB family protein [Pyrinomonadaceae bacterium]|nr:YihY/virulence factor BrkB family protein [Pyrinomonadaceae bacterium]
MMNFDYKDFFKRLYAKISDDDILGNAAQVAFYFTFALFPLLLFLMTLLGLILSSKENLQAELFQYLQQVMPASAFTLVRTTLEEVTKESSGGTLTVGVLITLWAAAAGIDNLRGALNEVYNLMETRSWWKTKLLAVLLTLGIGILVLIALSFIFYGTPLLALILPIDSPFILKILGWLIILLVLILAFALIYNFTPNHDPFEWKWISPGAISAIVLWILFSVGFQIYLHFFDSYAKTYGSLGAVIILLLWLYLTALVILIGGAINAIFDEKSGVKKEATDPKQVREEKTQTGKESKT